MKFIMSISWLLVATFAIWGTSAELGPDSSRAALERESFRNDLQMMNDHGQLVTLTLSSGAAPEGRTFKDDIEFWLIDNERRNTRTQVLNDEYVYTRYDRNLPTVFITHGWISSGTSESCNLISDAYIRHGGFNVIVVDWSYASFSTYEDSASQVRDVGQKVARMINSLSERGYLKIEDTILVGHSLGAHVMGCAGSALWSRVKAIFGLDPALPLFRYATTGWRLSKYDAKYVEIIHTNAGFLGGDQMLGHTDFFVNHGTEQPGCGIDIAFACAHSRAYQLYAESINTQTHFFGQQCTKNAELRHFVCFGKYGAVMGGTTEGIGLTGVYQVPTNPSAPFAIGESIMNSHY